MDSGYPVSPPAATAKPRLTRRLIGVGASYADVVRTPSYFPLWLGQLISNFGDTVHYIALVVLVFRLSGHALVVGGVVAAEVLPLLLLGPIAGVIVDRFSRKGVLIGSDLVRAALALSLVWPQGVWHAYAVAAGMAAAGSFFNPAFQAVIPAVTTERQRLAANSVAWSTGRLVQIIASGVAGGLIVTIGTGPSFAVNATTFVASAMLVSRLRLPAAATRALAADVTARAAGYLNDARTGLQYVLRERFLARLLLFQSLASLAAGGTSAMLVVLAQRHYGLQPAGFAWFIGAIGIGALLGPFIPNIAAAEYRTGRWLYVPYVIRGLGDVLLAIVTPVPLGLLLLFVYGLNTSTGTVVFNSLMQTRVPDRVRGRTFTLFDVTWGACRLVSLVAGGLLADAAGIEALYWAGGALLGIAGVIGLLGTRQPSDESPSAVLLSKEEMP